MTTETGALNLRVRDPKEALSRVPPSLPMSPVRQLKGFVTDFVGLLDYGYRKVGRTFALDIMGSETQVVFTDSDSLMQILGGSREEFGQANDSLVSAVGPQSMFMLDGDAHREARRRTLSAFTSDRMRAHGQKMKETADRWLNGLTNGTRFSAADASRDIMMSIILDALFGMQPGPDYLRFHSIVSGLASPVDSSFATAIALLLPGLPMRRFLMGSRNADTLQREKGAQVWDFLPWRRKMGKFVDSVVDLIQQRRDQLDGGSADIMTHLLRTARDEGSAYTNAAAFDEVMTLIFAGYQSSAITVSWALYRLAQAPEVASRLREEIEGAFPQRPIDPSQLDSLPYLAAVINETLRLHGVGIGVYRRVLRGQTIDGYALPAGTQVFAYTLPQHLDPAKWEYPEEFRPEQFLGKRLRPHEFAPFGAGYRRCIGASFAMYSLKTTIAQIVRRADFVVPQGTSVKRGMRGILVSAAGPVTLEVKEVRRDLSYP